MWRGRFDMAQITPAQEEAWLENERTSERFSVVIHWALRRSSIAMTEVARLLEDAGHPADPFSSYGWALRAYRTGEPVAAYNLAMSFFNQRDLSGYRRWLRRAARLGDADASRELKRFETRLPHETAHDIRRGRPYRKSD
jgi:TPR repeat protein